MKKASSYLAPSWSWASLESGVNYPLSLRDRERQSFIEILEMSVTPTGKNLLGTVSAGSLRVSAPISKVKIRCFEGAYVRIFLESGEEIGNAEIEERSWVYQKWCLLMTGRKGSEKSKAGNRQRASFVEDASILILDKADGDSAAMRRIGIMNRAKWPNDYKQLERKIITIL